MKRGDGQLQGDAAGRLQLELGWLSVVESVDNEINTVVIANGQIANDNLPDPLAVLGGGMGPPGGVGEGGKERKGRGGENGKGGKGGEGVGGKEEGREREGGELGTPPLLKTDRRHWIIRTPLS